MRYPGPVTALLAAGALCSLGGLVATRSGAGPVEAQQPPPQMSALPAASVVSSNGSPTVVTEGSPDTAAAPRQPGTAAMPSPEVLAAAAPPPGPLTAPNADAVQSLPAHIEVPAEVPSSPEHATALFDAMNAARTAERVPAFERNSLLDQVAMVRARQLVIQGYFAHYGPDGESAFSELAARGVTYGLAGENLARNNYPDNRTVRAALDGLMASPGHRANILEGRFTRAGVAAVRDGRVWVYVTVFMD